MKNVYVAVTRLGSAFINKTAPLAAYVMLDYPNIESCEKELSSWYGKFTFDIYTLDDYIDRYPVNHFTYEGYACAIFKNNPLGSAEIKSIPTFISRLIISKSVNVLNIISGFSQDKMATVNKVSANFEKSFLFGRKIAGNTLQDVSLNQLSEFASAYKDIDQGRDKSILAVLYYDTPISVIASAERDLYDINHISVLISNHAYLITISNTEIKLDMVGNSDFS